MKNYLILFISLISISSYSQSWNWSRQLPAQNTSWSSAYEFSRGVTDGQNVYLIGDYGGIMNGQTDTITSNGTNDLFVSKFDQSGNELWIKGFGGNCSHFQRYERIDGFYNSVDNNIYLGGSYINSFQLDTISIPSYSLDSSDIFITQMNLNGDFNWVKHYGSSGNDYCYLYPKPNGNILMIGYLKLQSFIDTFLVDPGFFLAEFDPNGNCIWANQKLILGNNNLNYTVKAHFLGSDIILGGVFNTANGFIDTTNISTQGGYDTFICRMDSIGNVKWVKTFGGTGNEFLTDLAISGNNIVFCMSFNSSFLLDNNNPVSTNTISTLLIELNANGVLNWYNDQKNSGNNSIPASINIDQSGAIHLTGCYSGTAIFGNDTLTTFSNETMYIAKYTDLGSCIGVLDLESALGTDIVIDASQNLYSIGIFYNSVSIGSSNYTSLGPVDIYLAKLSGTVGSGELLARGTDLLIYANPNNGTFEIDLPEGLNPINKIEITVVDTRGRTVYNSHINLNKLNEINVGQLPNGIYNLRINQSGKNYLGKFVIQN
jgi:hypothetical protein